MATTKRAFDVGRAVRRRRVHGGLTITAAATSSGMSCVSRWQRLELRSLNFDLWLSDLDRVFAFLEVSMFQVLKDSRGIDHSFSIGTVVRRLRRERKNLPIDAAADYAGLSSSDRWQRLETRSANLDRWLADLDRAAAFLGVPLSELIEEARRRA